MSHGAPGVDAAAPVPGLSVDAENAGMRLDRALTELAPGGLRGRRRRIAGGGVLLNGAPCRDPARRLRPGDVLALAPHEPQKEPPQTLARLLGRQGDFCFLFKARGLHSAALAGKEGDSLETRMPALCAPVLARGERPELLQRLDQETSGIVCAALTQDAAGSFRGAEAAGECEKRYLALLTGALDRPATARGRLDTQGRRTARLLDEEADALRWTEFLPLHVWRGGACARLCSLLGGGSGKAPAALTLAACRIRRGARHQIRAHAAGLGRPLFGDTRYAAPGTPSDTAGRFFLHHGFLSWPGHGCSVAPPWPWLEACLSPAVVSHIRTWFLPETLGRSHEAATRVP